MMRLLQLGRWFLLAMLIAWAVILIAVLVVGSFTVRTARELEQQENKENEDSHRLAA